MFKQQKIENPNYNSTLDPAQGRTPARLTLLLKTVLVPMDPSKPYAPFHPGPQARLNFTFSPHLAEHLGAVRRGLVRDSAGIAFRARSWTRKEFDEYRIRFKQAVERIWNDQIILLPPEKKEDGLSDEDYMALVSNPSLPPHVVGSLELLMLPIQTDTHAAIQVVRLDRKEEPLGRRLKPLAAPGEGDFGSYAWMMTNEDIFRIDNSDYRFQGSSFTQVPAAHEIGHWLGPPVPRTSPDRYVPHIDREVCSTTPGYALDGDCEYGHGPSTRKAIMGVGSMVTEYDAKPWLVRIRRHTGALEGWRLMHRVLFRQHPPPPTARQKALAAAASARKAA
jgi:hypothetical protein